MSRTANSGLTWSFFEGLMGQTAELWVSPPGVLPRLLVSHGVSSSSITPSLGEPVGNSTWGCWGSSHSCSGWAKDTRPEAQRHPGLAWSSASGAVQVHRIWGAAPGISRAWQVWAELSQIPDELITRLCLMKIDVPTQVGVFPKRKPRALRFNSEVRYLPS